MYDVECPYCGEGQEICHDDGYGYEEDRIHSQYCGDCDKVFAYTTAIHFFHNARKADCLNGDEHDYEPTITFPKKYTRMECTDCGDVRDCTPDEMAAVLEGES